jgi:metal-dependent amidase/aminoacylase/carboxypeptidase family protein
MALRDVVNQNSATVESKLRTAKKEMQKKVKKVMKKVIQRGATIGRHEVMSDVRHVTSNIITLCLDSNYEGLAEP